MGNDRERPGGMGERGGARMQTRDLDDGEADTSFPVGLDNTRDARKVQRVGNEPDRADNDEADVEGRLDELADLLRQMGVGIFGYLVCLRGWDLVREEQGTLRLTIASPLARAISPSEKGVSAPPTRLVVYLQRGSGASGLRHATYNADEKRN